MGNWRQLRIGSYDKSLWYSSDIKCHFGSSCMGEYRRCIVHCFQRKTSQDKGWCIFCYATMCSERMINSLELFSTWHMYQHSSGILYWRLDMFGVDILWGMSVPLGQNKPVNLVRVSSLHSDWGKKCKLYMENYKRVWLQLLRQLLTPFYHCSKK